MKRMTNGMSAYPSVRTAQGILCVASAAEVAGSACGSACGAGGESQPEEPKPAACGSACGAGDK